MPIRLSLATDTVYTEDCPRAIKQLDNLLDFIEFQSIRHEEQEAQEAFNPREGEASVDSAEEEASSVSSSVQRLFVSINWTEWDGMDLCVGYVSLSTDKTLPSSLVPCTGELPLKVSK